MIRASQDGIAADEDCLMKYDAVEQARNYLVEKIGGTLDFAVIMGSGVSAVDEILTHLSLLIPAFSLLSAPQVLTILLQRP